MARVYNFSAGPSCLPEEVLKECAAEMLDYNGTGQSVMEMSHRSKAYEPIIQDAEAMVRKLMNVPDNYKVLFVQGGGSTQFAMVAENLGIKNKKAAYIETGVWAKKAAAEAKRLGIQVDVIASSKDKGYSYIPRVEKIEGDYDYAYICLNNTIMGTHYEYLPDTGSIPLVADISSCVLSEPLDVTKFGLLFAGAQKNLAPAGVTLVIVREDLIPEVEDCLPGTPVMLAYKTHADNGSMYNTPPCYTIYVLDKVLHWIEKNGGAEGMAKRNREKADYLYNFLDSSDFYRATAEKGSRSLMNVPFLTKYSTGATDDAAVAKEKEINDKFVKEAAAAGFVNLKGHRLVGGMRASIYNAMTIEGVKALVEFMKKFAAEN
ncbi:MULTISPECIES: 3-phosphoserine/phosphohydroxythreonine transaminase [Treponema]|jgi:phosphoserine aminotransferase|uniref:Phosphoserine aminotransferase n=1 Tax=Treponema saccharophilum DSM 2985 TaxID=907348 RepID=H7EMU2_9SPIR|nr:MULTISPECIES: 3-phosphoserine/phosphohydroxythreonine transaminase [Treponema]EIC01006.1 phosphoserine aminotransferase [Treponema saccharophilum DSM 2985]MBQ5538451.1 3-phosphoserine/phosphohydroxythreonine transaminase [Treponema sp.]BDC95318.1 3-phosphoserine/phosphohydroxythreonine aminotransferase [Treponema saccharophilum]